MPSKKNNISTVVILSFRLWAIWGMSKIVVVGTFTFLLAHLLVASIIVEDLIFPLKCGFRFLLETVLTVPDTVFNLPPLTGCLTIMTNTKLYILGIIATTYDLGTCHRPSQVVANSQPCEVVLILMTIPFLKTLQGTRSRLDIHLFLSHCHLVDLPGFQKSKFLYVIYTEGKPIFYPSFT